MRRFVGFAVVQRVRRRLFVVAVVLLGLGWGQPAGAALLWDIELVGSDLSAIGTVEFATEASGDLSDIVSLELSGQLFGHAFTLGASELDFSAIIRLFETEP